MNKALHTLTVLSVAFGGYVLARGVAHGIAAAQPSAHEIVAGQFQTEPLRSMSAGMFTWFPAEAMAMREAMVRVVTSGGMSVQSLREAVLPITAPVHGLVAQVPDAGLVALLDGQIALHAQLIPEPLVCAQLVVQGASEATLTHPQMAAFDLEGHYADYFGILNSARHAPPGAPATDADHAALGTAMAGFPDDMLTAIEANDPADPRLCGAVIAMLTLVRDADFPGAERVRREMLLALASG